MRVLGYFCALAVLFALPGAAQMGATASSTTSVGGPSTTPAASPVLGDVLPLLAQIQATARTTTADVSLLSVRKWKVGNDVKDDAAAKAEAIQRNLTVAMPSIIAQVQTSPADFAANFKLYRTLGVLYDVLASLTESAGAFGSKSEFQPLATDLNHIDQARRALGDRLESLAGYKDAEIARLRSQANAAKAAAAAQPKKVIVDDDEKKPVKKPPAKKKPPANPATQPSQPSSPNNPQ